MLIFTVGVGVEERFAVLLWIVVLVLIVGVGVDVEATWEIQKRIYEPLFSSRLLPPSNVKLIRSDVAE